MHDADQENREFELAAGLVNHSHRHLFLTGKAGTGKTTFLKYIRDTTFKKTAVVAPTGVAAINAGGVTMHSFFQLPFGPYVPGTASGWNNSGFTDNNTLFKHIRFNKAKRELLKELELLIIDEVSMVRADMLDAVDAICRHFRQQPQLPFGGLQVLYIGDLFQLPPVVNDEEWKNILSLHYKSPFFFDAQVMNQVSPVIVELKKIYRQDEVGFISILNNIRNNEVTEADLDRLHEHFDRSFEPPYGEIYITLTTHNNKADALNSQELAKLRGEAQVFAAEVKGEFGEKSFPADKELQLKEGAQVMFVKNDKGESRKFYNGKIATVTRIDESGVYVIMDDDPNDFLVEKETWKNIRYAFNPEKDSIEEEELGTFKQYPLRLAWAITIHKSQGLTFEKAIIDAGASFAAGQVYVALSRLTSLRGLVLFSRIHPNAIHTDERVLAFVNRESDPEQLEKLLEEEQTLFVRTALVRLFDWSKLVEVFDDHHAEYESRLIPEKEKAFQWSQVQLNQLRQQQGVADKFSRQLTGFLSDEEPDHAHIAERSGAAADYFSERIEKMLQSLEEHIEDMRIRKRTKKYVGELGMLRVLLRKKKQQIQQARALANGLAGDMDTTHLLSILKSKPVSTKTIEPEKPARPQKGESQRISLALFREGKDIATIAGERGYAVSTIESHLVGFIPSGEIKVGELVPEERREKIERMIREKGGSGTKDIKDHLPPDYSYNEIRAVLLHLKKKEEEPAGR